MSEIDPSHIRLALLIDADNARPDCAEALLAEVARHGHATVRRAYGDWTSGRLGSWKNALLEHSISPMQQFAYTRGKNSTDSSLIIDAMDLLHAGGLDGFCLVSSDSDFTRLASRIRESGRAVFGFGERHTPRPFVAACDRFTYLENLGRAPAGESSADAAADPALLALFRSAAEEAADSDGWTQLGSVGSRILSLSPDFDPRNWGYRRLSDLANALPGFEVEERPSADGRSTAIYLRPRSDEPATEPSRGRRNRGGHR